ncbi:MAG: hypothetical protein R2741_10495 [Methanolobus sp.]
MRTGAAESVPSSLETALTVRDSVSTSDQLPSLSWTLNDIVEFLLKDLIC